MKPTPPPARLAGLSLTSDGAIGAVGGCLAVGALAFGVYMNVHGPSASLGTSHDFTVFAQLAPHAPRRAEPARTDADAELDTLATASIPAGGVPPSRLPGAGDVPASIIVEAADRDSATLDIDGSLRTVRVGDSLPGAGDIVAIMPGPHPMLKTSRGFVLSSRGR